MDLGLEGSRILVTGGASNIGRAIVLAFAGEGARVAIADLDGDQAKRTADAAGGDVPIVVADMASPEAAAEAGVISFAKSIAHEHGRHGVRSNVVAPGLVMPASEDDIGEGSLWRAEKPLFNEEQVAWMKRRTPLGRLSTALDIAAAVLFLAS